MSNDYNYSGGYSMSSLNEIGRLAKKASVKLSVLSTADKNKALLSIAYALKKNADTIIAANKLDISNAEENGIKKVMLDRLLLTKERIGSMADGIRSVAALDDPVGKIIGGYTRPNGLKISKVQVPLGVIAIIYEARPNVTADAAALTLKSGNAVILRGGKEAILSNKAIVDVINDAGRKAGLPVGAVSLVTDTSRESAYELMRLNKYVDVIIPRGGKGLIQSVVENATVPSIETGVGNCHIYVDEFADLDNARDIIINAKTSRPSVCNAAEKLIIHKSVAQAFLPEIVKALKEKNVEILGDEKAVEICPEIIPALADDWYGEFLDLKIAVKVTNSIDEAIDHINEYGSKHSEAIITKSYENTEKFFSLVDAAAVYANASTRFTDGGEFGLGAEIGISTQKLHARGPMGLDALTTSKYVIRGNGQIR